MLESIKNAALVHSELKVKHVAGQTLASFKCTKKKNGFLTLTLPLTLVVKELIWSINQIY